MRGTPGIGMIITMNMPMRGSDRAMAAVNVTLVMVMVMVMTDMITGTSIMGTTTQRPMLTMIICTPRMAAPQEQHRLWPPRP